MVSTYKIFKIVDARRKSKWHRIQINNNHTLQEFDRIIRESFDLDTFDHLSMLFIGKRRRPDISWDFYPDGSGPDANIKIKQLEIEIGDKIGYLYDFGANHRFTVTLEKEIEREKEKDLESPVVIK